jgi:hypothetical protein
MTALDRRDPRLHSWIILMHGRDESDPLFLQVNEAEASALRRRRLRRITAGRDI